MGQYFTMLVGNHRREMMEHIDTLDELPHMDMTNPREEGHMEMNDDIRHKEKMEINLLYAECCIYEAFGIYIRDYINVDEPDIETLRRITRKLKEIQDNAITEYRENYMADPDINWKFIDETQTRMAQAVHTEVGLELSGLKE
jgi:hypothetical protein